MEKSRFTKQKQKQMNDQLKAFLRIKNIPNKSRNGIEIKNRNTFKGFSLSPYFLL